MAQLSKVHAAILKEEEFHQLSLRSLLEGQ